MWSTKKFLSFTGVSIVVNLLVAVLTYAGTRREILPLLFRLDTLSVLVLKSLIFSAIVTLVSPFLEGFQSGDFKPDSRNTSCAMGSVPGGNGLDCRIPTDRYGL
jgi:hypothetical protein